MNWLNNNIEKHPIIFLTIFLFVLFFISFLFSYIFVFVPSPIGIISSELSKDWLQWMGAFVGGAIGGIFAFVGIKITLENQRKIIQFENKRKALPFIDVKTGHYDYKNKYIQVDFCFTEESKERQPKDIPDTAIITMALENVGLREMYDLYIGDIKSTYFNFRQDCYHTTPILYCNKSMELNLFLYEKGSYDNDDLEERYDTLISPIIFKCYFRDCYDNWYHQKFSISLMHNITPNVGINQRALDINLERCEIMSQPIEISQNDLPWENGKIVCHC
ncbi:hypothetical protein [Peribacillus simplex]|uniref:hypothetical protein n=1 Tax=Peribacillus simplex TaxID=1478 RepID=UPI000BA59535|nr:hypothetical protein [Peribacillus simplex]PAL05255.1 hypothetical protein B8W99_26040 [Peribacillus simplex]